MKQHFFMSAHTQFDNLGDALVNDVLLQQMRQKGRVHLDCKNVPPNYLDVVSIAPYEAYTSRFWFYLQAIFLRLKGDKVTYILKPGHIFIEHYNIRKVLHDIMWIFIALLFKVIRIPIKRFGASIGHFTPISLCFERIKAKLSSFIGYREDYSKAYMHKYHLLNGAFCPDLLFLPEYTVQGKIGAEVKTLVFSFRAQDDVHNQHIFDFMLQLAKHKKYDLIALSHVTRDSAFQQKLIDKIGPDIQHIIYDGTLKSRHKITDILKNADVIVSNRLHALLHGAMYGALPIAYIRNTQHKISSIFAQINLTPYVLSAGKAQINDLFQLVQMPIAYHAIDIIRQKLRHILQTHL